MPLISFSFTYMSNGKREFVPRDQVFPWIVPYRLLLLHKNKQFHASFIQKNYSGQFLFAYFLFDKFSTWIWRFPLALNVTLKPQPDRSLAEGRYHERWPKSETAHVKSLAPRVNDQWYLTKFTLIFLPNSCGKLLICCWCFQVGGGWICRVSILWESSVEHVYFAHDSGS